MRYCTCNRGVNFRNRTSIVHNYSLGVDICSHCGGIVPSGDADDSNFTRRYNQFIIQAKTCSGNGNHLSAIEFFKKAHDAAWNYYENCNMLSAIAREYEALGDYESAEDYWDKCCVTALTSDLEDFFMYVIGKGDFHYRIGSFTEAIATYEHALEILNDNDDINFSIKHYARATHYLIDSYHQIGKDDLKEKYHSQLKGAIDRFIRSGRNDDYEIKAKVLSKNAWDIYEEDWMVDEALILIDSAIELESGFPVIDYMRKAKILQGSFHYEEALKYYDIALSYGELKKEILKNRDECKAECIKSKLKIRVTMQDVTPQHLEQINKALKILPDGCDNAPYLNVKAEILNQLGEPVKAWICRYIAAEKYDEVEKIEKQLKKLKSGGTYINITGIHYYQGFEPFKEGTIVDLIMEPDNHYDKDAIRVEINGEKVGYVANSRYTVIKEVKSATDIKNTGFAKAEVQFIWFNEWVIAKLI